MKMPVYRVTEQKVNEYLEQPLYGLTHPWKNKSLQLILWLSLGVVILTVLLTVFFGSLWIMLLILFLMIFLLIICYIGMRKEFYRKIAKHIQKLVTDPEMVWLNAQQPEDIIKKHDRKYKGVLHEDTFKILAYLKKEGGSQGIYHQIKSLQNNNSATVKLKRLRDKNLVKHDGIDFRYLPWKFKVVDERNQIIKSTADNQSSPQVAPRIIRIEKILNKAWELMLDEEGAELT